MHLDTAAALLKELGHSTRLRIYRRLVTAGTDGLSVGELQQELEIPGSTLSHHISALLAVSLIKQRREGRTLFCTAQYATLQNLLSFLADECCSGSDGVAIQDSQEIQINHWKLHNER